MQSVISSSDKKGWFNATLFWKNLTRFWPLWALYGLLWLFWLPVNIFLMDNGRAGAAGAEHDVSVLLRGVLQGCPTIGLVYGVLVAMALFSYLMNSRSTGMLHALPIRREGLFLTNFFSGCMFIFFPTLVVTLLALVAQGTKGVLTAPIPGQTLLWFGVNFVVTLMFFSFAVCCAMFTGHILALPAFYGIMNFLVIGVCFLIDMACAVLLTGFSGFGLSGSTFSRWCTPVYQVAVHLRYRSFFNDVLGISAYSNSSGAVLIAVCYSLVLCVAFAFIAVLVYHNRQLERAGDVVTVGWVRPVFQYGVGVCVGLALGGLLYTLFFQGFGPWAYIACVAASALIGAFAARMLLKKSLKVFGDWKGPTVLLVCMALLLAGIKVDVFGFQRRVPDLMGVASVKLFGVRNSPNDSGDYLNLEVKTETDPELAQAILDFHKALVSDLNRLEDSGRSYRTEQRWDDEGNETAGATDVELTYYLKDGRVIRRSYDRVVITAAELADPDSYAGKLARIIDRPDVVKDTYLRRHTVGVGELIRQEAIGGSLYAYGWDGDPGASEYEYSQTQHMVELSYEEANILWEAFMEDLDAGRVRRYLLDDRERMENCYYHNNLLFQMQVTTKGEGEERATGANTITVTPERSETSLMKALEELGLSRYLIEKR